MHNLFRTTNPALLSTAIFAIGLMDGFAQNAPVNAATASFISAGGTHTCAVTDTGRAKCWGLNDFGQLGDGTKAQRDVPVNVQGNLEHRTSKIDAGGREHTCAVLKNGTVKCWGRNLFGEVGDGTYAERLTAVSVLGLNAAATAITLGQGHTCALTSVGGAKCWGWNRYGQLGDGNIHGRRNTPEDVVGLTTGVTMVVAGSEHTCALTSAGAVKCWGNNQYGQIGDGSREDRDAPTDVVGLQGGLSAIAAGDNHTCVLMTSGSVECWGDNSYDQLGHGTRLRHSSTPIDVVGVSGAVSISAGYDHTCAVMQNATVRCWGRNDHGQLGDGTTTNHDHPVRVRGLSDISAVSGGGLHTCALLQAGHLKCWGNNVGGQLGNGTTTDSSVPVRVVGF